MENNDWQAIYRLMEQVDYMVPRTDSEGCMHAVASLDNYPPRIEIAITTSAGRGDQRSSRFTKAELSTASKIMMRMTSKAIENYPWLKISNMYPELPFGKGYVIKPQSYPEAAKLARSQTQCA